MTAHSNDIEDILATLRMLNDRHAHQVAANGGVGLKTKESIGLHAIADYLNKAGWVDEEDWDSDNFEAEPEAPEED